MYKNCLCSLLFQVHWTDWSDSFAFTLKHLIFKQIKHDNEKEGTKYPQSGMGEKTPFTKQNKEKERDMGHNIYICLQKVICSVG